MCEPLSMPAVMGGLTALTGAGQGTMSFLGQGQQARQQNAYYKANAFASNKAEAQSFNADQTQMVQERNAASQDAFEAEKKFAAAQGTAITAAGQAGVGGLSVDQLLDSYQAKADGYRADLDSNYAMRSQYMQGVEQSQMDQTASRINSVQRAQTPSILSAGLSILGAGVNGLGQYEHDQYLAQPWKSGAAPTMNMDGYR